MKMTCCIIDDEPHAIRSVEHCISKTEGLELLFSESNPVTGLKRLGELKVWPDIVFCDIDMPDFNGMELGNHINEKSYLVYITAHAQYAVEAFEKEAIDYLLKPISIERFQTCVQKCRKRLTGQALSNRQEERSVDAIFIHVSSIKGNYVKIPLDDLVYIRSKGNNLSFHRYSEEEEEAYMTFRELEKMLDAREFIRVHRSYIINFGFLDAIRSGKVVLTTGDKIDLTLNYRKELMKALGNRVVRSSR
jgi:DNA-binding LytR/AlgR family response regulator